MARLGTATGHVFRDGDGFNYRDDDFKWKVCFHYTVRPLPSPGMALQMARTFQYTPQFWMDVPNRELVQAIDTNLAGMALKNLPGGVETNGDRVIQVEILGDQFTIEAFTDADLQWIANVFCKPLVVAHPSIANVWLPGHRTGEGGNMANVNSVIRLSNDEYDNFSGWMGHANVPENEHTDMLVPGQMERLSVLTYAPPPPPPVVKDWFDMATKADLAAEVAKGTAKVNENVDAEINNFEKRITAKVDALAKEVAFLKGEVKGIGNDGKPQLGEESQSILTRVKGLETSVAAILAAVTAGD